LQASEREILWVMRVAILGVGVLAMIMGITIETIYGLWYLCADLVYVILFPQLVSVVYLKGTNTYGSLTGYCVGMLFRFLGGEPLIHLPAAIKYPNYNYEEDTQRFPFRTLTMLMSFFCILVVSYPLKYLFESGKLKKEWDVFQCIVNIPDEIIALREPSENGNSSSIHEEMSALKKKGSLSGNGTVLNPGLKFNKEDLLAVENQALDVTPSPIDDPSSTDPLNRGGFTGGARP
jgi:high affinity choline transporter 7